MIYKHGQYRIPHFSHKSKVDCIGFSENESQTHLKGKLMFKQQVEAMGHPVEIEATMMSIEQRADVFFAGRSVSARVSMQSNFVFRNRPADTELPLPRL
ncbi:competence protein CoiA family protein [Lentilactobacillus rapi]|uniref:competence protein CoiA family protein n=1 Tax=Lentilactobacillus rapi TaxID=481723 RepID=UPI0024BF3BF0|nr:competence protein CoiA family protein [Lentilactobacillus rapi]